MSQWCGLTSLSLFNTYSQRYQGTASQGKMPSSQGCQTDIYTLTPSILPSVNEKSRRSRGQSAVSSGIFTVPVPWFLSHRCGLTSNTYDFHLKTYYQLPAHFNFK